jgi:trans-aconitate methyltransferase
MLTSRNSDRHWEQYGRLDPYFGVLSDEKYRSSSLTEAARAEFFESGKRHVEQVFEAIRTHLLADFHPTRAVDFGCGVGRTTIPLAEAVDEVIGIDISDSMLKEARRNAEARGVRNIVFARNIREALAGRKADFIHSFIVFQHIPVARGERILCDLLDHLAPGGVGAVHVTYHAAPLVRVGHWVLRNIPFTCNLYNVLVGRSARYPIMQSNFYSMNRLLVILQSRQCSEAYTQLARHKRNFGAMIYFRKA